MGLTPSKSPLGKHYHGHGKKRHIGIIGGGTSGLILMKELLDEGHEVTCFERNPIVGGVYCMTYDEAILTTSSCLTAFSMYSDGKENKPVFWDAAQYREYINAFVEKFNLLENVLVSTTVEDAEFDPVDKKWRLQFKRNRWVPPFPSYGEVPEEDPDEPIQEMEFDGLAVCTGTNNIPSKPKIPGEDDFEGEISHMSQYHNASQYKGKRVLIIGAGESASDICNEISKVADKVAIAIRKKHGHLIPRTQSDGRVTDLNTNRCRYSNPYVLGDWVGWANQIAKKFAAGMTPEDEDADVLQMVGKLNLENKTSAFSKFGCKNAGFVEAIVRRGAELHRDTFYLTEDGAIFEDGREFQADAVILCTGFKNSFNFFKRAHPNINSIAVNPRNLFKKMFFPGWDWRLCFFGFARPAFGSLPPTVEMQTRYYSLVVSGKRMLPPLNEMKDIIEADRQFWENRFQYDAMRVKGLVDFQVYLDQLASMIDCMPPIHQLLFTDPRLWYHIMFGPFTTHQYRLRGPHSDKKRAREVLLRQPIGDFLESSITLVFLIFAKILSLLGFKQFTPNNF